MGRNGIAKLSLPLFLSLSHIYDALSRFLTLFYSFYETQEREIAAKNYFTFLFQRVHLYVNMYVCVCVYSYVSFCMCIYVCKIHGRYLCLITRRFASSLISQIDKLSLVYLRDFYLWMYDNMRKSRKWQENFARHCKMNFFVLVKKMHFFPLCVSILLLFFRTPPKVYRS